MQQKINEIFDIICGTSTGSILAALMGIRGYSAFKCEQMYKDFCGKIFIHHDSEGTAWGTNWSRLMSGFNIIKVFPSSLSSNLVKRQVLFTKLKYLRIY